MKGRGIVHRSGRLAALLALPPLAAVSAAVSAAGRGELLGDYCAHPPDLQHTAAAPPPLGDRDAQLVGLQVIFRHGARDLLSDLRCWQPWLRSGRPAVPCGLRLGIEVAWSGHLGSPPLVRHYGDLFPDTRRGGPAGATADSPSCALGQLLDEAPAQFEALATALRKAYVGRLPLTPETTRLYATETDRATASLYLLQNFLFNGSLETIAAVPRELLTRPASTDPWTLRSCPRAHDKLQMADTLPVTSIGRFRDFGARWHAVTGTEFIAAFKDCLILAECAGPTLLEIPPALQANRPLISEALAVAGEVYAQWWQDNAEACRLLSAPIALELERIASQQLMAADGGGAGAPSLALWGTHDTTIATLLVGLGLWDGVWPAYSEALVLEVYKAPDVPRGLFRLLRGGHALRLPRCNAALCDLAELVPPNVRLLEDITRWAAACFTATGESASEAAPASADWLPQPDAPRAFLGVGAVTCGLACFTVGLLVGKRWHARVAEAVFLNHRASLLWPSGCT